MASHRLHEPPSGPIVDRVDVLPLSMCGRVLRKAGQLRWIEVEELRLRVDVDVEFDEMPDRPELPAPRPDGLAQVVDRDPLAWQLPEHLDGLAREPAPAEPRSLQAHP